MALPVVVILGAGDLGTACALRMFRSGFKVILIEAENHQNVHYTRNFSGVIYSGIKNINGVQARISSDLLQREDISIENFEKSFLPFILNNNEIPLVTESELSSLSRIKTHYLVIADPDLMGMINDYDVVDEDVKIITFHEMEISNATYIIDQSGLVIYPFLKEEFEILSKHDYKINTTLNYIKAPIEGIFISQKELNSSIRLKEEIGKIGNRSIVSLFEGKVTGLINSGTIVTKETNIAEINSLKESKYDGKIIPDEYTLLSGGVLEAILFDINLNDIDIS